MKLSRKDLGISKEPPKATTIVQEHKLDENKLVDNVVSKLNPKFSLLQKLLAESQQEEAPEEDAKEWEHEIIRDDTGLIQKIISKRK